jgi:hypothetical protein
MAFAEWKLNTASKANINENKIRRERLIDFLLLVKEMAGDRTSSRRTPAAILGNR